MNNEQLWCLLTQTDLKLIAAGDTTIVNYQLSIVNSNHSFSILTVRSDFHTNGQSYVIIRTSELSGSCGAKLRSSWLSLRTVVFMIQLE